MYKSEWPARLSRNSWRWPFSAAGNPPCNPRRPPSALYVARGGDCSEWSLSAAVINLANIAWAFASAGFPIAKQFALLAMASKQLNGDFNAQNLTNIAWSFATTGFLQAERSAMLAKANKSRHENFNAQNLANTAGVFATVGFPNEEVFSILANASYHILRHFISSHLSRS